MLSAHQFFLPLSGVGLEARAYGWKSTTSGTSLVRGRAETWFISRPVCNSQGWWPRGVKGCISNPVLEALWPGNKVCLAVSPRVGAG